MAIKDLNFKKFLIEKGERVGLVAAGGIALLLVVFNLFWPGKGILSPSPKEKADSISKLAVEKDSLLTSNAPTTDQLAELITVDPRLLEQASNPPKFASDYRTVEVFASSTLSSSRRRNPNILVPEEWKAELVLADLRTNIMDNREGTLRVGILNPREKGKFKPKGKPADLARFFNRSGGMGPSGMGSMKGGGSGMMGGMSIPGLSGLGPGGLGPGALEKAQFEINYVKLEESTKISEDQFAETLRPVRLAMVVGSFPYKAQIEEFRKALKLAQPTEVFGESIVEKTDKGEEALPGFQFLGFTVERRTIGPDGKPSDWQLVDLESPKSLYCSFMAQNRNRTEEEQEKLKPLLVKGLWMPRPVQIKENSYPKIETDLPKIKKTLEALDEKKVTEAVTPTDPRFNASTINPFGGDRGTLGESRTGSGKETKPEAPNLSDLWKKGKPPPGTAPIGAAPDWSPPEYCLMRFLDVDLQPGKVYEYRAQIQMTNPNYGKKEGLAWPGLADDKVLKSDWVEVRGQDGNPLRVVVPRVFVHYYAVDQKTLDPKYKGMNAQLGPRPEQAVFQVHRWFDFYRPVKTDYPVGDWLIAERLFAYRGESLGLKAKIKVPYWSPEERGFVLARNTNVPPKSPEANLVEVEFGTEPNEAPLLVDFQGGANQTLSYKRPIPPRGEGDRPGFSEVRDSSPLELVLLSPEGKLLARNSVTDEADAQRKERHDNWHKHIKEVEEGFKGPAPFGKPGDKKGPFGGD